MLAKLFLGLTDYPIFRRIMWKPIYEWLAGKFDFHDWHFMNYGYSPSDHEKKLKLNLEDETHRYAIQFEDTYFDVVINVESCHAYGSVPKFLSEVKRVLSEGGYFLCTDLRSPDGMITLRRNLINSGLHLVEEEAITENVVKAISEEESVKLQRINKLIPGKFYRLFKEFAGVKGSQVHTSLSTGKLVYHRFVLQKNSNNYGHQK